MPIVFERPSLWQRTRPWLRGFDGPLAFAVFVLACVGLTTLHSAGFDFPWRFQDQVRNYLISALVMFVVAQIPPQRLMQMAVPLYTIGVALLIAVALFGLVKKGARRWIDIGPTNIQPSELMKIGMPLMLAWWFQKREGQLRMPDFIVAAIILAVPTALIIKQPDLGTALLVMTAGLYVIFFAGLSWRLIIPVLVVGVVGITAILVLQDRLCEAGVDWRVLHEYQKNRVCTLLDPTKDPLGKGFHTLQAMIAIGSGGVTGKGYMLGTQTHLEFIPERTSDFIFAVYAEEFGLIGNVLLLLAFTFLIFRGLTIALEAPTLFSRLLAGAITLIFFTYAFVNMGMVMGVLPVVGVPLPFVSYGGTAMVTLGAGVGILMSIARSRRLIQS
jgi:rod shape determining protein RodA